MSEKIVDAIQSEMQEKIDRVKNGLSYTKNFRSATAEEWYIFIPGYQDPRSGGAAGKAIIHYNLYGNRDVFINTTVILLCKVNDNLTQLLMILLLKHRLRIIS
jgi:hypothetical protein